MILKTLSSQYSYKLCLVQVTASYMKMISSYVMQDDQLFPMLTVHETFMFAAEVRLPPSISREEKKKRVNELLDQLGLEVIKRSVALIHLQNV